MPLMKARESALPKRLASSIASLIETVAGMSGHPTSSNAAIRNTFPIDDRHAHEPPVRRGPLDEAVDLLAPIVDAAGEAAGELHLLALGGAGVVDALLVHQPAPQIVERARHRHVAQVGLEQRLERKLSGPAPRGPFSAPARRAATPSRIAAIAALKPLLPAFVPARSIACSMVSVVRTPKKTGTPVSIDAAETAEATADATRS